eukprot:365861-Chlamydomonas_euryale.AAC.7
MGWYGLRYIWEGFLPLGAGRLQRKVRLVSMPRAGATNVDTASMLGRSLHRDAKCMRDAVSSCYTFAMRAVG